MQRLNPNEDTIKTSISIEPSMFEAISVLSLRIGISKSAFIRKAIATQIKRYQRIRGVRGVRGGDAG